MRFSRASIVPLLVAVILTVSGGLAAAETSGDADGLEPPDQTHIDNLPSPAVINLRAIKPVLPTPFAVILKASRKALPAPFTVTLKAQRPQLPAPFKLELRATHPTLSPPFVLTLKAERPSLPAPMQVLLKASRPAMPDPFAVDLRAERPALPAPLVISLRAAREAGFVEVPQVLEKPLGEASGLVAVAGLVPAPELGDPAAEREQIPGLVYFAAPEPGTPLSAGEAVVLRAYGPRPKQLVPDIETLDLVAARGVIAKTGFDAAGPALGPPAPADVEPGTVSGTDPPAGTELDIFSSVTILLYGPHPVAEPPANEDEAADSTPPSPIENEPLVILAPPDVEPEPPVIVTPPDHEPDSEVILTPPVVEPGPAVEPTPPAGNDLAEIWLGRWELTSTTFKVPRRVGDQIVHVPVKQIVEIRREGDRVVGTIRGDDGGQETFDPFEPGFAENRLTADIMGSAGSRISLELTQSSGSCSGMISGTGAAIVEGRVQGFMEASWALTCVRLAN